MTGREGPPHPGKKHMEVPSRGGRQSRSSSETGGSELAEAGRAVQSGTDGPLASSVAADNFPGTQQHQQKQQQHADGQERNEQQQPSAGVCPGGLPTRGKQSHSCNDSHQPSSSQAPDVPLQLPLRAPR